MKSGDSDDCVVCLWVFSNLQQKIPILNKLLQNTAIYVNLSKSTYTFQINL